MTFNEKKESVKKEHVPHIHNEDVYVQKEGANEGNYDKM